MRCKVGPGWCMLDPSFWGGEVVGSAMVPFKRKIERNISKTARDRDSIPKDHR